MPMRDARIIQRSYRYDFDAPIWAGNEYLPGDSGDILIQNRGDFLAELGKYYSTVRFVEYHFR